MIRTILTTDQQEVTIKLPRNFMGKKVEILAFVIDETLEHSPAVLSFTVLEVAEELKQAYHFNRDEANER
jgi:hypothetical protein